MKRLAVAMGIMAVWTGVDSRGSAQAPTPAGIQWYATWESGRRQAERTGRPILLVSAAPHCAGVSGIW